MNIIWYSSQEPMSAHGIYVSFTFVIVASIYASG